MTTCQINKKWAWNIDLKSHYFVRRREHRVIHDMKLAQLSRKQVARDMVSLVQSLQKNIWPQNDVIDISIKYSRKSCNNIKNKDGITMFFITSPPCCVARWGTKYLSKNDQEWAWKQERGLPVFSGNAWNPRTLSSSHSVSVSERKRVENWQIPAIVSWETPERHTL